MVAGRGRMPCDVGVVHTPCGAAMPSVLTGISFPFMVTMGVGLGGGTSLLNLLFGLKVKEGVCICCRLYGRTLLVSGETWLGDMGGERTHTAEPGLSPWHIESAYTRERGGVRLSC